MKNKTIIIITIAVALMTMAVGCDKTPANGPLDGQWQLMSIETPQGVRDTKADRSYLCFQLQLTQWFHPDSRPVYARFTHRSDSIRFYDFARVSAQAAEGDNDEWITPREMYEGAMDDWGIHATDITYHVRRLDGSHLELERQDTLLTLRKF